MSLAAFYKLPDDKQNLIIKSGIKVFSQNSYAEASTDTITEECGISKGILFYYFGNKKTFYLYLLDYCIKLLIDTTPQIKATTFYDILFENMDEKMSLNLKYPEEILFVNQASKETNSQVSKDKTTLIGKYMLQVKQTSALVLNTAVDTLNLKQSIEKEKLVKGLSLYVNTIVMQYLGLYKDRPLEFFDNSSSIKKEIKEYIDLFLHGVEED